MKSILSTFFLAFFCLFTAQAQFVIEMNDGSTLNHEGNVTFSKNGSEDAWSIGDTYSSETDIKDILSISIAEPAMAPAKIGDYYYSDGTWSDGGLISIDDHGLNAVWADEKPAPLAGKTVVGIVFQTNASRIAETENTNGFVNGYVVAVKNAHGTQKNTTWWTTDYNFNALSGTKLASSWYANVKGYENTMKVQDKYSTRMYMVPAFDWTLNDFPLDAPETSSGWFLPSTGQVWDMIANLCGHEAANVLKEWQTKGYDATYYCAENVSYNVIDMFNATMEKIADEDKEVLVINDANHPFTSLWTSNPYDSESACIFNIGINGLVECMAEWFDGDCFARPVLAF